MENLEYIKQYIEDRFGVICNVYLPSKSVLTIYYEFNYNKLSYDRYLLNQSVMRQAINNYFICNDDVDVYMWSTNNPDL